MSEIFIRHPEPWVGIPEHFPVPQRWASAHDWAAELVGVLVEVLGEPTQEQREATIAYLVTVADGRESRLATRVFVAVTGWSERVHIVDMAIVPSHVLGGMGIEEFAGANDQSTIEKPYVEPFVSDTGVAGIRCVRYTNSEKFDGLVARSDFVFAVPEGLLRLYTTTIDLVAFEKVQPMLADLARSVSVEA